VRVERRGHRAAADVREVNSADPVGPWFHQRPGLTIAVAAALYAVVLALRSVIDEPQPITLLFCFPIALLAVAFGFRAGLLAGATGILLVVAWVVADGAHLSFWGWVTRAAPMLLLGGLLGDAADRLRHSEADRIRLRAAAPRHRDAVELQDGVLQELAAAKWALEAGRPDRGLEIVTNTLDAAQRLVSDMLRDADAEVGARLGRP
jgi:signal transduction histidine kinase